MTVVEAAVETLESALAGERAGVDRVELCANLGEGGTTPDAGLIAAVAGQLQVPVFVMIRSRPGDFVYTDEEIRIMTRDIQAIGPLGASGFVLGALAPDHRVDVERTRALVDAAEGLPVTFHRAFDLTPSPTEALEELIQIGVGRVLTSGTAATASEGVDVIAALTEVARDRIGILAGGGIRDHNVVEIIRRTRVGEVHARFIGEARMRMLVNLVKQ